MLYSFWEGPWRRRQNNLPRNFLSAAGRKKPVSNVGLLACGSMPLGWAPCFFTPPCVQYRLLPKWISLWGILAILLHIAAGILVLLGLQKDMDTASLVMNLPIAVQEMVMAVWLVAKGFNTGEQSL